MLAYLRVVGLICVIFALIGMVIPSLISAKSDIAVFAGIALIFAIPVVLWKWKDTIISDIKAFFS